jgi:hypothetical protein
VVAKDVVPVEGAVARKAGDSKTGLHTLVVSIPTLSMVTVDLELAELYVELLHEVLKDIAVFIHEFHCLFFRHRLRQEFFWLFEVGE